MRHGTATMRLHRKCPCDLCWDAVEGRRKMPKDRSRYSFDELARLRRCGEGWHGFARRCGVNHSTMLRDWRGGLTDVAADRAACALGLHPVLIWTEWADVR